MYAIREAHISNRCHCRNETLNHKTLIQMRVIPIYRLNKFNYDSIQLDAAACPASRAPPLTSNKGTMNRSPVRQPLRLRTMNSGSTPATPRSSLAMSVSAAMLLLPLGALAQTGGPSVVTTAEV